MLYKVVIHYTKLIVSATKMPVLIFRIQGRYINIQYANMDVDAK
jgi:hypothetical protein